MNIDDFDSNEEWVAYQQGRADAEKEDLVKACIKQLEKSDADEVKVSADTKDGYKITVIVELKEQTNE